MNLDQFLGLVRTLLAAGGPVAGLFTIYGYPQDKVTLWLGLALAVIPPIAAGVWSMAAKTDRAKVTSASQVPGATVMVDPRKASANVMAAAADPNLPDVRSTR